MTKTSLTLWLPQAQSSFSRESSLLQRTTKALQQYSAIMASDTFFVGLDCLLPPQCLEIDHVVARHAVGRYSYSKIFIGLAWLADLIGLPSGIGGIMTTLLMELLRSRRREHEADKIGLKRSAKDVQAPRRAREVSWRLERFVP